MLIKVDQTTFSGADERGNCLQACVATLFGVAIDSLPDLRPCEGPPNQSLVLRTWLYGFGWTFTRLPGHPVCDGYYIASGPVARCLSRMHAVVMCNGGLYHDPHPSRAGLCGIKSILLFYPLQPRLPEMSDG